jgi:hypothetical protein
MKSLSGNDIMQCAAILCYDVAVNHAPILFAERTEPEDPADSGWQFVCGAHEENWKLAQVWAIHDVLTFDPSLKDFIGMPYGTVLTRASANSQWNVINTHD